MQIWTSSVFKNTGSAFVGVLESCAEAFATAGLPWGTCNCHLSSSYTPSNGVDEDEEVDGRKDKKVEQTSKVSVRRLV